MADLTITNLDPLTSDEIRYELGRGNWAPTSEDDHAWIPALRSCPGDTTRLTEDQVIDILILGDGYTDQTEFKGQLQSWMGDFFAVEVYERFRGTFRIRALFTRSAEHCSTARKSYYGVAVTSDGRVSSDHWWNANSSKGRRFRERLFESIGRFDMNTARYPGNLSVGGSGTVIHNELAGLYSNLVVLMLVRTTGSLNASGRTRRVKKPDAQGTTINVGFGAYSLHEFGHAFAYLEDEYIEGRGSRANRRNPSGASLFTVSNLSFNDNLSGALWVHLSPWGMAPRQAAGSEPSPIVGWLWRGGEQDRRVWHSEYQCLMNGLHDNYAFTTVAADDPTAFPPGACTRIQDGGANLRWRDPPRYCLWCQEIVAMRILEKTGQLEEVGDPGNINQRGKVWHARWVSEWRRLYWNFFDVTAQIQSRETLYANPSTEPGSFCQIQNPDGSYRNLWRSDLYKPFEGESQGGTSSPASQDDEELAMLNA